MKERIVGFFKTYLLLVCVFVVQKPLFMLYYHHALYAGVPGTEWLRVIWHGLPLDCSLAGYLTVLPALFLILSAWTLSPLLRRVWCGYFLVVSIVLSLVFTVDVVLYGYWGFRLDATPLFYLFTSPKDTLASASGWMFVAGVGFIALYAALLYGIFYAFLLRKDRFRRRKLPYDSLPVSLVLLVLTGLLFIPIRGGFTTSTMNTGKVYYSENQRLNHAAINPLFSLMESLSKQKDFSKQYRFMAPDVAGRLFLKQLDPAVKAFRAAASKGVEAPAVTAPRDTLFNRERPDIVLVIMESFSSKLMETFGGVTGVAPSLDSLARESVLFTNFYANSFRTDRGMVAILSGYPAQPTMSIMKFPQKSRSLPSLAGSLKRAGYATKYYYGGDADFTNMRSYVLSSGFDALVCDRDFPIADRLSKWGVHDHLVFRRLLDDMAQDTLSADTPRFRVLQTSSSHEPFKVPYHRLDDERLNAFAYTDSCVGDFIRRLRKLPEWEKTVVVLVPDHLGAYPETIDNFEFGRYQIPLLLTGGAVKQPRRIDVYGSQQDLAATLLAQLSLPHGEFTFSKDMLNPAAPHFAFFTVPDAFGVVEAGNRVIYDNKSGAVVQRSGKETEQVLAAGQAYLQKLYDDIAAR
ncbi:MAG: sulfatase-like hydrolase/transferase [Prevotellaceae bacterium]|nr:sulfatase-like hydrolase/transferase [Prevotellaceae bacterium]